MRARLFLLASSWQANFRPDLQPRTTQSQYTLDQLQEKKSRTFGPRISASKLRPSNLHSIHSRVGPGVPRPGFAKWGSSSGFSVQASPSTWGRQFGIITGTQLYTVDVLA